MKYFLIGFIIGIVLTLAIPSKGAVISVMADEATGEVVAPTNLESRLVAVDMGALEDSINDIQEDMTFVWTAIGDVSNRYSVLTNSFLGVSNALNVASNFFQSIGTNHTYQIQSLSNALKSGEIFANRTEIVNGTATLSLATNYYYVYCRSTLTNFVIPNPANQALVKLDMDYDGVQTFAWGGALASATNLPVPPPTGKSSYVLEWLTDATNWTAYP